MAVRNISYAPSLSADAGLHPSEAIWASCPVNLIDEDPTYGVHFFEDFLGFGKSAAVASNVGRYDGDAGQYISYEDTSCTLTNPVLSPALANGLIRLTLTGTAHKAVILEFGPGTAYSSGSVGSVKYTDNLGGKLWFEARIGFAQITATTNIAFVGLAQSGVAVVPAAATSTTTLFDSVDGVGNVDLLGFDVLAAGPATLRGVYGKNGSARASAGTAQTLVAATYYKVGFIVEPSPQQRTTTNLGKKVRWFVNGLEVLSLTDTLTSPFPTGAVMTPAIHFQNGGSGTPTMDVDFVRWAQLNIAA